MKIARNKINNVGREGAAIRRFPGLPLWTVWGGKGGYLPLILPLASEVRFCFFRAHRWETMFCRLCMLCR
jgi:hypothetical protein